MTTIHVGNFERGSGVHRHFSFGRHCREDGNPVTEFSEISPKFIWSRYCVPHDDLSVAKVVGFPPTPDQERVLQQTLSWISPRRHTKLKAPPIIGSNDERFQVAQNAPPKASSVN